MANKRCLEPEFDDDNHNFSLNFALYDQSCYERQLLDNAKTSWSDILNDSLELPFLSSQDMEDLPSYDLDCEMLRGVGLDIETWTHQEGLQPCGQKAIQEFPTFQSDYDTVDQSLCYGMLCQIKIRLIGDMQAHITALKTEQRLGGGTYFILRVQCNDGKLYVVLSNGTKLALLNNAFLNAYGALKSSVKLQALVVAGNLYDSIHCAGKVTDAMANIDINVYGSAGIRKETGDYLAKHKLWLQRPDWHDPGVRYDNPHFLRLKLQPQSPGEFDQLSYEIEENSSNNDIDSAVAEVYSELTRGLNLGRTTGDVRLATQLMPHQEQALNFMLERENGPVQDIFSLWKQLTDHDTGRFQHLITGLKTHTLPQETGGGILADEMGMGKTFSVLALIVRTLQDAHCWATSEESFIANNISSTKMLSRATLIVVPSPLILNNWIAELEDRVGIQEITYIIYHGSKRTTSSEVLRDRDIVFTTYQTLISDISRGKGPLTEIGWYRIVLDEAHFIRRSTTKFFRGVSGIDARSRWCLTGTPIQNRLDDLGALLAFLKVEPFDRIGAFRRYISLPFSNGGPGKATYQRYLRLLIDSVCLRRERTLLSLENVDEYIRYIDFSAPELDHYQCTKAALKARMEHHFSSAADFSRFGMFQAQLHLRLVCNHGTFEPPFSFDPARMRSDVREDMGSSAKVDGEIRCDFCCQDIRILSLNELVRTKRFACKHRICEECYVPSLSSCSICTKAGKSRHYLKPTSRKLKNSILSRKFQPYGESTKISALLEDLLALGPEDKSIVFSCWTSTLDLIEHHLQRTEIRYDRIDGDLPLKQREERLKRFDDDATMSVLIMTTGVGSFGINLIAANRVFLFEPQWNPSIESQAVGRALRIGQNQRVAVVRYVVRGTVEEDIRRLQHEKSKMAKMANGHNKRTTVC